MPASYKQKIQKLIGSISTEVIDFSLPIEVAHTPSQASSNFITNKAQGDWAEKLVLDAINKKSKNYVAVKYGKSDDITAGDEKFKDFFQEFQAELDTIGKRPDILIFNKSDFDPILGFDISNKPHNLINPYVKKAVAGIEVRSSAFLYNKYTEFGLKRKAICTSKAIAIKNEIIKNYSSLLKTEGRKSYLNMLEGINKDTIDVVKFKTPIWRSNNELSKLSQLFKELNLCIKEVQKREELSITPKVEDLKVVYKWIETFGVPHFYFQVFFDKIYGISFDSILKLLANSREEGSSYSIESDVKNQNKTTIKINSNVGIEIASRVDEPKHSSVRKEMSKGRLLFYVKFDGGQAYINIDNIVKLLGLKYSF